MSIIKTVLTAVDETGPAFTGATTKLRDLGTEADKGPGRFSAMSAAAGAFGASAVGFLGDAARAAEEGALSEKQLALAVENSGQSWDQYSDKLLASVDAAQMKYDFDDGDARVALQRLVELTGSAATAESDLATAMDISRAKGISLEQASIMVGKAHAGNDGILKKLGITFDKNATQQEKMALLQDKYAGQAAAFADTTGAKIDILKMKFGEWSEGVGASLNSMSPLFVALPGLSAGFTTVSGVVTGTVMPALGALGIGLGPLILIIGAVAIAAGLLYLAWNSNFGGIQEKSKAVFGWLTGTAWPAVKTFFSNLTTNVGAVYNTWRTTFSNIASTVRTTINTIKGLINTGIGGVNKLIGAVNSIPGIPDLPTIPGFAGGVRNFGGGLAIVGERGPEMVHLPSGSNVYTNGEMQGMMLGGSPLTVNVDARGSTMSESRWRQICQEEFAKIGGRTDTRFRMGS